VRVYVESNFVLELALEQEQHQDCRRFIELAASKVVDLVLPAFAVLEPYQTLVRRRLDGHALHLHLHLQLQAQAKHLERTASISAEVPRLQEAADLLLRAAQDAASRFVEVRKTLVEVARMIPIDCAALRDAETLAVEFDLVLPDAVMLASVLSDAAAKPSPSVFINRNTKGPRMPELIESRSKWSASDRHRTVGRDLPVGWQMPSERFAISGAC
jgi:predicted nucleic acid-binding protein